MCDPELRIPFDCVEHIHDLVHQSQMEVSANAIRRREPHVERDEPPVVGAQQLASEVTASAPVAAGSVVGSLIRIGLLGSRARNDGSVQK
jgi:hypothetical protein